VDGDCDDGDPSVHPGAVERPNGIDDDCDGAVDEDTIHSDDDGDGYSEFGGDCDDTEPEVNPGAEELPGNDVDDDCDGESPGLESDLDNDSFAIEEGDCDDANPAVNPGAAEICGNEVDDDCDGATDPVELCASYRLGGGCGANTAQGGVGPAGATAGWLVLAMVGAALWRRREVVA
jgi:MYXO-CTERM domain-containing protein